MNRDILRRVGELECSLRPTRPRQVFRFIDDPEGAASCSRENPDALVISHIIVSPPTREAA